MDTPAGEYFKKLRAASLSADWDACRSIIVDLAKQPTESEWLEWKETDGPEGDGSKLKPVDNKNLARTVCAFANTQGGLLVWGVKDKSRELRPFEYFEEFARTAMKQVVNCTLPPISGVDCVAIPSSSKPAFGFVVMHVPLSLGAPHQLSGLVGKEDGLGQCLGRFGSESRYLTIYRIADLLGRRPAPVIAFESPMVKCVWEFGGRQSRRYHGMPHQVRLQISVDVRNVGSAKANELYGHYSLPDQIEELPYNRFSISYLSAEDAGEAITQQELRSRPRFGTTAAAVVYSAPLYPTHTLKKLFAHELRFGLQGNSSRQFAPQYVSGAIDSLALNECSWTIGCDGCAPVTTTLLLRKDLLDSLIPKEPTLLD